MWLESSIALFGCLLFQSWVDWSLVVYIQSVMIWNWKNRMVICLLYLFVLVCSERSVACRNFCSLFLAEVLSSLILAVTCCRGSICTRNICNLRVRLELATSGVSQPGPQSPFSNYKAQMRISEEDKALLNGLKKVPPRPSPTSSPKSYYAPRPMQRQSQLSRQVGTGALHLMFLHVSTCPWLVAACCLPRRHYSCPYNELPGGRPRLQCRSQLVSHARLNGPPLCTRGGARI